MPRKLISTIEEFQEHYIHFTSNGYHLLDTVMCPLDEGIYNALFINGVFATDSIRNDNDHVIRYTIECLIDDEIIRVTVTKETASLAFDAVEMNQQMRYYDINVLVIKLGRFNCAFLNPFDFEYFQPKERFRLFKELLYPNKNEYLVSPKNGDIIKYKNGRFVYIIENLSYLSNEINFALRSTTGEIYKMKIMLYEKAVDNSKSSNNLDKSEIDVERINLDSYRLDRSLVDLRGLVKVNIRSEDFECLPKDPKCYPIPLTPIKVNKATSLPYEEWYEIPEFETLYSVSNFGRIKSYNYAGYLYNEGILASEEIKLCKDLNKDFFKRAEILTFAKQSFSSHVKALGDSKQKAILSDKSVEIKYKEGLWYFGISIKDLSIYTSCYFLEYSIAIEGFIVLINHLEEEDIPYNLD
ncbi:NUMOD4 domain-containing protein [Pontibacter beigongshangensis]|uniref:NUMOD4 domain-containing protein n=1 Tax=Pontibacter beigongshangensis TaxID=2574733 RepID=UPI00164FD5C3|nr:NUMOD4 domain-containing protein [Pontibacter beigongshangensis]